MNDKYKKTLNKGNMEELTYWIPNNKYLKDYDSDFLKVPEFSCDKINYFITAHVITKSKKLRNIGSALHICTRKEHKYAINAGLETRIYFKDNKNNIHAILTIYNDIKAFSIVGFNNSTPKFVQNIKYWALFENLIKTNYEQLNEWEDYFDLVYHERNEVIS